MNTKNQNPPAWLHGIDAQVLCQVPLAPLTWYKLGGPAEVLAHPNSFDALSQIFRGAQEHHVPVRVLGSGANLLVSDEGVDGVVVRLDQPAFAQCEPIDGGLRVGAGYDLFQLVHHAAKLGLSGLENIAGVPASLGGAIRMNAGGAYGEIGTYVRRVKVMEQDGTIQTLNRDQIVFGYRSTDIAAPLILEADLALTPGDPAALREEVKRIFTQKKASQPMGDKSCGCVFKNPVGPAQVRIDGPDDQKPAGFLIDQCGLKGLRAGGASVLGVHANFIVVEPGQTTASDVKQLIEQITEKVFAQTGVRLQRELVVW